MEPASPIPESTTALCALTEISANGNLTQRGLSRSLGISLGRTNQLLRELAKGGLIRTEQQGGNRRRYTLTALGETLRSRRAVLWARTHHRVLAAARGYLRERLAQLRASGHLSVVCLGGGELLELMLPVAREIGISVQAVLDPRDPAPEYCGIPVVHDPDDARIGRVSAALRVTPGIPWERTPVVGLGGDGA